MAPVASKRRRVEDEVRPKKKKKIQNFKKQKRYHSSSEDESDNEPATTRTKRASDAPRPLPKRTMKPTVPTAELKAKAKPDSKPKSILKQLKPAPEVVEESSADERDEDAEDADEVEIDQLELNTALNAFRGSDSGEDDLEDDDEPDLDEEDDEPNLDDLDDEDDEPDLSEDDESETSAASSQNSRSKKKRNDPSAFATSISKILDTKLSTSKRSDPVLSRSKSAAEANRIIADSKLEQKARAQIRAERKAVQEKGRVKDLLGLETPDVETGKLMEEEKRLKKTAQRGVVKLFNAVRAAQVKAEEAMKQARSEGVVGIQKREERVNEMSKQGFLDLISSGGKAKTVAAA